MYREVGDLIGGPKAMTNDYGGKENKFTAVLPTLSEGGVRGTPSFSKADGGAVVCLPVLGGEGSHGWVCGPCAQERRRGDGRGRAVC